MVVIEDYVSFEIAKQLKEKGFDVLCTAHWFIGTDRTFNISNYPQNWNAKKTDLDWVSCPTHQMAMKWLREKGIYITIVYGDYPSLNKVFWTPQIDSLEGFDLPNSFYEEYDKYEVACEAALKYALENLI